MEIVSIISNAIIVIIVWFATTYIKKKADNLAAIQDARELNFEKQKGVDLATKQDIGEITTEIESVKTSFQTFINESQIKFEKLHNKRFSFIIDLYGELHEANQKMEYYCEMLTCTEQSERSKFANDAYKLMFDVYDEYQKNSILSTEVIDELMLHLNVSYRAAIKKIMGGTNVTIRFDRGGNFSDDIVNKAYESIEEGMKILNCEIKDIMVKLKSSFKDILENKTKGT